MRVRSHRQREGTRGPAKAAPRLAETAPAHGPTLFLARDGQRLGGRDLGSRLHIYPAARANLHELPEE